MIQGEQDVEILRKKQLEQFIRKRSKKLT